MISDTLTIQYPREILWALQQEPDEFEEEARIMLALRLYERGKITTGLAAQLAGVPRTVFIFLMGKHELSPFGQAPDELEDDWVASQNVSDMIASQRLLSSRRQESICTYLS